MNECPSELRSAISRVIELEAAVGLAIGALEIIKLTPHDFNHEGVGIVLAKLKKVTCNEE